MLWSLRAEVNWDEFALLARATDSLRDGVLYGGGRPGLATIALMPLAQECSDALRAIRIARLWWTPFSLGILAGLWLTLVRLFAGREGARRHALIGVLLLVLTPNFIRFVIQVRSDQPAIALGLLAGALLLGQQRRLDSALFAGTLLGLGYLFSQKLVYVGALAGLLVLADVLMRGQFRLKREVTRALCVTVAFGAVLLGFRLLVATTWAPPPVADVGGQMDVFQFYREGIGFSYYGQMLPGLLGPLGLLTVYLIMAIVALGRVGPDRRIALLSLSVFALGLAVAVFHAGAFPYFWMTLGLFPAVGLAIGMPLLESLPPRWKGFLGLLLGGVTIVTALAVGVLQLRDGQSVQRHALEFVEANVPMDLEGFQTTRALSCRERQNPMPILFGQNIAGRFGGVDIHESASRFVDEFRTRPIGFLIRSFRMDEFPESVRRFWADHYVAYSGAVHLAGTSVAGPDASPVTFEVIVPGYYAFYPSEPGSRIVLEGTALTAGDSVSLDRGVYLIDQSGVEGSGIFALAVPRPPGPSGDTFYSKF